MTSLARGHSTCCAWLKVSCEVIPRGLAVAARGAGDFDDARLVVGAGAERDEARERFPSCVAERGRDA